jgi:hypothetical protein
MMTGYEGVAAALIFVAGAAADHGVALQASLGAVNVVAHDEAVARLASELRERTAALRPKGSVELRGIVTEVGALRRLAMQDERFGRVVLYIGTLAKVSGTPKVGSRIEVRGTVVEDYIQSAPIEVTAFAVEVVD